MGHGPCACYQTTFLKSALGASRRNAPAGINFSPMPPQGDESKGTRSGDAGQIPLRRAEGLVLVMDTPKGIYSIFSMIFFRSEFLVSLRIS